MKLCICKLDDTLSQIAKDGGPSWLDGLREKICPKVGKILGVCCGD